MANRVVQSIYKRDSLTVLFDVYKNFTTLILERRGTIESFKNYVIRFATLLAKLNAHGTELNTPEPINAFMLSLIHI